VVHLLRGPISSAVSVTISRSGTEPPREFHLRRALVVMPTVTMTRGGKIAIFRVKSFNQSTTQRLAESITAAQREAGGRRPRQRVRAACEPERRHLAADRERDGRVL